MLIPKRKTGMPGVTLKSTNSNCMLSNVNLTRVVVMNLLFVCSENKLRSPTGEEVFSAYSGLNAIGAGTNNNAATPVSGDLIEWADVIFVMENTHRNKISRKFRALLKDKRMICLNIPDNYKRMDPSLVKILKEKVAQHVHI